MYAVNICEVHYLHGPACVIAYSTWEIYFTVGKAEHNVKQTGRIAGKARENTNKKERREKVKDQINAT